MRSRSLVVAAFVALAVVACSKEKSVLEDGGPRIPADAGIATDVTFDRIQLDGKDTYEIRDDVESFATRSHHITALLSWEGKYVHLGLDDEKRVRWIAGIGLVSGKPPRVTYSGVLESFDASMRQATFEDGTVLVFAKLVKAPKKGREVVADIDADTGVVVKLLG